MSPPEPFLACVLLAVSLPESDPSLFAWCGEREDLRRPVFTTSEMLSSCPVEVSRDSQLAFIFDLDGVLVHSMPLHVIAWQKYLDKLGITVPDLEARMHGKRNPELVRELMGNHVAEDVAVEHGAAKERLFRELLLAGNPEQYRVPGVAEFLERHKDMPKAIGSNAEPANIQFVLDRFGLAKYFDVIIDGQQVGRPKPFPDIYLRAAEQLHTEPANCIVFEDSPVGIEAARAAGMRLVGVETTPTEFTGLDLHIRNFLDPALEPWLQAQKPVEHAAK